MLSIAYFVVLGALAVLSTSAKRIFIICGFYTFYAFLTVLDEGSVPRLGPVTVYRALYLILAISLITRWIKDPALSLQMRRCPFFSYTLLIVLLLASALYSQASQPFSGESGSLWGRFVVISLFWMAAFHVQKESDLKIFAATTVAVTIVLASWVIWSAAHLDFQAYRGGVKSDQNYVSSFVMVGALPLLNSFFAAKHFFARVGSLVLVFFVLFTCLLLASRGMFAAFAVAAIATTISALRHRRRALITAGVVLIVTCGIAFLLPGGSSLIARFNEGDLTTLNERTIVWSYSLKYFADSSVLRMMFGQGLGSDPPIINPVVPELGNYHNDYLRWLMDRGVVGLAAFLFFLYSVRRRIAHSDHPLKPVMMGWLALLLVSALSEAASDSHLFWIVLGIICASCALTSRAGFSQSLPVRSPEPISSKPSVGSTIPRWV
ncbi:MAG TPA: O-antigen ligase family protein [Candidatus Angelobacter sp.]|nr:O-antigen ligase family protein [Candidatus Angelobacter sp.]